MSVFMIMKQASKPGNPKAQNQRYRQQDPIMAVELQLWKQIAQRYTEEHAYCETERWPKPHWDSFSRRRYQPPAQYDPHWGNQRKENIGNVPRGNGMPRHGHDRDETH